jgi:hypothetical protein
MKGRHHQSKPPWWHFGSWWQRAHTGYYRVLCGREIAIASMVTPPGFFCEPCNVLKGVV